MQFKEEEVVTKKSTIDVQSGEVHKVIEKNPWSSKASDRIFIELESPFSISTKESSGICLFIIKKAVLNRL